MKNKNLINKTNSFTCESECIFVEQELASPIFFKSGQKNSAETYVYIY